MGLFDKLKKKKPMSEEQEIRTKTEEQKIKEQAQEQEAEKTEYVSNIGLSQLGVTEQLDREVVVISDNGNIAIDRAVHMCITQNALDEALQILKQEKQKEFQGVQLPLGMGVDNVIQQPSYDALIIYGLAPSPFVITKADLMPIKDVIDSFCIMYAAARNKITNENAFELMESKTIYILGSVPMAGMKKGDIFGVEKIKRTTEAGEEYGAVKCFLTKESAEKYNNADRKITEAPLAGVKEVFGTVIIEPHRNYWIEFK